MKLLLMTTVLALVFLPAGGALAKNNKAKHSGKSAVTVLKGCPPGLAKKNNGCRPPGQLKRKNGQGASDGVAVQRRDHVLRSDTGTVLRSETGTTRSGSANIAVTARGIDHVTLQSGERIRIGDRFDAGSRDRARVIDNPGLFGLEPSGTSRSYFRIGEAAVLVDDNSREVLRLITLTDVLIK